MNNTFVFTPSVTANGPLQTNHNGKRSTYFEFLVTATFSQTLGPALTGSNVAPSTWPHLSTLPKFKSNLNTGSSSVSQTAGNMTEYGNWPLFDSSNNYLGQVFLVGTGPITSGNVTYKVEWHVDQTVVPLATDLILLQAGEGFTNTFTV